MGVNLSFILSMLFTLCVCFDPLSACDDAVNRSNYFRRKPNCGELQCHCVGRTAHCVGNKTMTTLPQFSRQISDLFAECYDLSNLESYSLKNVRDLDLDKLYLRRNDIQNIAGDTFRDFQHLTVVEISGNVNLNLGSLLTALKDLNKSSVMSLFLQENKIKTTKLNVLKEFTNLRNLSLSGNRIKSLKGIIVLEELKELDLSGNYLKGKIGSDFCKQGSVNASRFPNLENLYLGRNNLGHGGKSLSFIWRCLDKLKYLDLSNNTIAEVNITLFEGLKSLKYLNLASNWIKRVDVGLYPPLLESIDFFDNQLTGLVPPLCFKVRNKRTFPNLKHIFFGRNFLQKLDTRWNCLPGIETLNFNNNDVRSISNHTFSNFKNLKTLRLNNMIPWNKRFEPEAFKSTSLQNLDIRFNRIDFSKPQNKHLLGFSPNVTWLDISYNNFIGVSGETLKDILAPLRKLDTLILQRISLRTFPVEILENLTQLKVLNIENNQLHSVEFPPSFDERAKELKIQNISVAKNLINTITVKALPKSVTKNMKYLDLSDNQFLCDCDMEWFRDNINASGFIGHIQLLNWPEKYLCGSPTALKNHSFKDYQPHTVCKPLNPVTLALIAIGSFLFVFTIMSSLLYWNRWYLRYWWYKMSRRRFGGKNIDPELQPILDQVHFDGYVVSNHGDNTFVHHPFRELIEDKLGYKLHIWERDAKNGALVDVMCDAIYASKHIVVIVSNNLIKDTWCKFQVDVALDRSIELQRNCALLVVLEDVDFKSISKAWCVLLTKTPTAHWSSDKDSFKQKLFEETIKIHLGKSLNK